MPRGVKKAPKPIVEQIAEIDGKIAGLQDKINEFKAQKKALEKADREEKLSSVLSTIEEKGLTLEEAIDAIKKHKK